MKIEMLEKGVVAHRPDQMYAWPGITKAANGDILVSASERKFHIDPYGREVLMVSRDNGRSWDLPKELYNSEMDDRDANITTLANGDLIFSWFTSDAYAVNEDCVKRWPERAARVTSKMREELLGTWMMKSTDNGETWGAPKRMPVGMHISPVELSDGSLITIGWSNRFDPDSAKTLSCHKSTDAGESWTKTTEIECPVVNGRTILNENHVLETENGRLIALFRKCNDFLYQAESDDFGETWSKPVQIGIWGFPPHMLKLSDGRILCAVGHRKEPFSVRGVISEDGGATWNVDDTFTIHEWNETPDIGYPVSVELSPGEILTVFYCRRHGLPEDPAKPEGILYARYNLK